MMTTTVIYEVSGTSRAGYSTKVRIEATNKAAAKAEALRRCLVKVTRVVEVL